MLGLALMALGVSAFADQALDTSSRLSSASGRRARYRRLPDSAAVIYPTRAPGSADRNPSDAVPTDDSAGSAGGGPEPDWATSFLTEPFLDFESAPARHSPKRARVRLLSRTLTGLAERRGLSTTDLETSGQGCDRQASRFGRHRNFQARHGDRWHKPLWR